MRRLQYEKVYTNSQTQTIESKMKVLDLGDEHESYKNQQKVINERLLGLITKQIVTRENELYRAIREQILCVEGEKLKNVTLYGKQRLETFTQNAKAIDGLMYDNQGDLRKLLIEPPSNYERDSGYHHKISRIFAQTSNAILNDIDGLFHEVLECYKQFYAEELAMIGSSIKRQSEAIPDFQKIREKLSDFGKDPALKQSGKKVDTAALLFDLKPLMTNELWKVKFYNYVKVVQNMRRHYLKEIQVLKDQKEGLITKKPTKQRNKFTPMHFVDNELEIQIFHPTDGLNPDEAESFNKHVGNLKQIFELRMNTLSTLNKEMSEKLALYMAEKKVADMSAIELVNMAFLRGEDVMIIWKEFKKNCDEESFKIICEREFEDLISDITQETVSAAVNKITNETKAQVKQIKYKMQREINGLRLSVQYKSEEIDKLKQQLVSECDAVRRETFRRQEERYTAIIERMKVDQQDQIDEIKVSIREEYVEERTQSEKQHFHYMFDKWRMITMLSTKLNGEDGTKDLVADLLETFQRRIRTQTEEELEQVMDKLKISYYQISQLKQEREKVQFEASASIDEIASLNEQIGGVRLELVSVENKFNELEQKYKKLSNEMEIKLEELQAAKEEITLLTESNEKLEQYNLKLRNENIAFNQQQESDDASGMSASQDSQRSPQKNKQTQKQQEQKMDSHSSVFQNEQPQHKKLFNAKGYAAHEVQAIKEQTNNIVGDFLSAQQANQATDTTGLFSQSDAQTFYEYQKQSIAYILKRDDPFMLRLLSEEMVEAECQTGVNAQETVASRRPFVAKEASGGKQSSVSQKSTSVVGKPSSVQAKQQQQKQGGLINDSHQTVLENDLGKNASIHMQASTSQFESELAQLEHHQIKTHKQIQEKQNELTSPVIEQSKQAQTTQAQTPVTTFQIVEQYRHKNVNTLAVREQLKFMYSAVKPTNIKAENQKYQNSFDEGPKVFKRLSLIKNTSDYQWALKVSEQVQWFIRLKDSGLIKMTRDLQKLIEETQTIYEHAVSALGTPLGENWLKKGFEIKPPQGFEKPAELLQKVQQQIFEQLPRKNTKTITTQTDFWHQTQHFAKHKRQTVVENLTRQKSILQTFDSTTSSIAAQNDQFKSPHQRSRRASAKFHRLRINLTPNEFIEDMQKNREAVVSTIQKKLGMTIEPQSTKQQVDLCHMSFYGNEQSGSSTNEKRRASEVSKH